MLTRTIRLLAATVLTAAVLIIPASQPAMATFSGHNGLIVYSDSNFQIATMNANGTGSTPITNFADFAEAPQASADGKWIVFDANDGTNTDLFKIHPDGSGQKQLTNDATYDWAPSFSPSGKKIIFSHGSATGQIYIINSDGTHEHMLSSHIGEFARYSPDGKKIAYGDRTDGQIHIMNADGTHNHALTNFGNNDYPDWSPSGTKIGWTSNATGSNQIWMMKPDGTHDHAVTTFGNDGFSPVFSPDGKSMLYNCGGAVCIANVNGTGGTFLIASPSCCEGWLTK
jgi:TolB protein